MTKQEHPFFSFIKFRFERQHGYFIYCLKQIYFSYPFIINRFSYILYSIAKALHILQKYALQYIAAFLQYKEVFFKKTHYYCLHLKISVYARLEVEQNV